MTACGSVGNTAATAAVSFCNRIGCTRWGLGRERGAFAIDSEWLVIKFRNGTVVEAAVVTD